MAYEIFICYRRKDTAGYAGRLHEHLKTEYGVEGVLFDVATEGDAELLRGWVQRVVPQSAVVLVLMGDRWLDSQSGRRRIDDPNDIVRFEIELALSQSVPIIPVLVDGAPFPTVAELPEPIKRLLEFKAYPLSNANWDGELKTILSAVSSVAKTHAPILRRGVEAWNRWRSENPNIRPNLRRVSQSRKLLAEANLSESSMESADFEQTDLSGADLKGSNLDGARLRHAVLTRARLAGASLRYADLSQAQLTGADLRGADLRYANLNEAELTATNLKGCRIFGVSAWNADLSGALQENLRLDAGVGTEPLTTDSIETAIVLHLLLTSGGVRQLLNTLTSKVVLILGRFTPERKEIVDALREALRRRNYLPMLFDFKQPPHRNLTETLSTLAHMSRFVIADLTDAKSVPQELMNIVPYLPSVPVQPILLASQGEYGIFEHFRHYPWVLEPFLYEDQNRLLAALADRVIRPAEAKAQSRL